jgi:hypothetical protein
MRKVKGGKRKVRWELITKSWCSMAEGAIRENVGEGTGG